ncbi:hypothetical protein LTR08_008748 [Meristemomyces frigidus]|nr:hypothetical protein LTR08_008748 [Meristemomyces frigidus]
MATPGALPDDCAERRDVYVEDPESGECPLCQRREAFRGLVGRVERGVARVDGDLVLTNTHSSGLPEVMARLHDSVTIASGNENGISRANSGHSGHAPCDGFTPFGTISPAPSLAVSISTQSTLSICDFGSHDLEDVSHGGLRCRICGIVAAQRSSIRRSIDGSHPPSAHSYATPAAFTDDDDIGDDEAGVVGSVHDGLLPTDRCFQHARTPISEPAGTLRGRSVVTGSAAVSPESPATTVLSTATSALWRERDMAVRQRDMARNF